MDYREYRNMFKNNITPIEGSLLGDNEKGILIATKGRNDLYMSMNTWFIPKGGTVVEKNLSDDAKPNIKSLIVKTEPVFMGFSENNSSSDIRVPVKGIIRYRALNTMWGHFAIMDIESYRRALGYFSASDTEVKITSARKKLLDADNLDSFFGSESLIVADK